MSRLGEAAFARIHRLEPPAGLRARWRRWLVEVDVAHSAGREMNRDLYVMGRDLAAGGDSGTAWLVHSEAAYQLGRALGLEICSITVRYRE